MKTKFIPKICGCLLLIVMASSCYAQRNYHYYRLQLKSNGQYLDADHCGSKLALNPGSDYDGGSCQLWRIVNVGDGWFRLQLKSNGQYLDADHCGPNVALNPGSDYDGGSCQLWKMVLAN